MKILVIAPHMDDEVLGCAGTIAKHVAGGDKLSVCFIAHRIYNHHFDKKKNETEMQHAFAVKKILNYAQAFFLGFNDERLDVAVQDIIIPLEKFIFKIKPEIIYCPFRGDNHQDHRAVFDAVRVVIRPSAAAFVKRFFMYETPSSTEQSPPLNENAFLPNYYVNITAFMGKKLKALSCYKTEKRIYPHPRAKEAVQVLAKKRGTEIGFKYAEAFMLLREKW